VTLVNDNPSLEQLIEGAIPDGEDSKIQVREILETFGQRSYGPALFFFALLELLPFVSAIPGMYIITASVLIILSGQLLAGRPRPWLPKWLLSFSLSRERMQATLRRWKPWIKWVEKLIRPRLEFLVAPPFLQGIAAICICLALTFFPLAPIPASEKVLAIPVAFFALAITVRDGVLALIGFAITAGSVGLMIYFWSDIWDAGAKALDLIGL
jgi:hypothetical protein